jgi:hypothetical protein
MTKIEFYSFISPSRQKQYQPLNLVSVPRPRKIVREAEDPHRTDEFIKVRQEARTLLERERNKRKANIDILQQEILRLEASKNNATNPETKERIQDIIDNYQEVIQNTQLMIDQPMASAPTDDPFALQYQGQPQVPAIEGPQVPAIEGPQVPAIEEAPNVLSDSEQEIYDNIIARMKNDNKLDASLGLEQLKKLHLLTVEQRKEYIKKIIKGGEKGILIFKHLAIAFKEYRQNAEYFTEDEQDLMSYLLKALSDTLNDQDEEMKVFSEIYNEIYKIKADDLEKLKTDEAIVEILPENTRIKINIRRRTKEEKEVRAEAEIKTKAEKDKLIEAERTRIETVYVGQGQKKKLEAYLRSFPPPPVYNRLGEKRIEKFIADNQKTPRGKSVTLDTFRTNTLNLYKEALELPPLPTLKTKTPQTEEEPEQEEAEQDEGESSQTQQPTSNPTFVDLVNQGYDEGAADLREKLKTPSKQPESPAGPSTTKTPSKQPELQPKPTKQPESESARALEELSNMFDLTYQDEVNRRNKFTEIIQQLYNEKEANPKLDPPEIDVEKVQTNYYLTAMGLHELIMEKRDKPSKEFAEFMLKYVFTYIYEGFDTQYQKAQERANLTDMKRLNSYMNQFETVIEEIKTKYDITEPVKMSEQSEYQWVLNELDKKGLFGDSYDEKSLNHAIAEYIKQLYSANKSGTEIQGIDDYETQKDIEDTAVYLSQRIRTKTLLSEDFANFVIEYYFEYLRDVVFADLKSNYTLKNQPTAAKRIEGYQEELTREIEAIKAVLAERKREKKSGRGFKKNQIDKLIMSIIDILEGQRQINMGIFSQDELLLFKSILDSGMTQKEQDKVEGILKGLKGKIGGLFDKQYPHKQTKPYYLKR